MDPTLYKAAVKGNTSDGDFSLVEYLKRDEENGYQVTPKGNTMLHVAANEGHSHFVGEVLKITPELLCHQNKRNETALHIAANEGHTEVVRVLLSIASEETLMRMTNENGDTALHKAVRSGHVDVVKIILEKEKDPEFEYPANNAGETPLYLAAESGFLGILREILDSCKNPNYAAGPFGRTPLHAAVVQEHKDCARILWQRNKSLCEEPDKWGWNSLHYAVKLGLIEVVSDMLQWKKSLAYLPAGSENDWTTTIHIAAREVVIGNKDVIMDVLSELLQHCPDCWEMVNSRGQNALHVAVMNNQAALLLTLLKSKNWGSLVDEPDNDGNTPMHLLAFGGYFNEDETTGWFFSRECVPDELENHPKAKKMTFNKDNQTPLDILSRAVTEKSKSEEEYANVYPFHIGQFGRRCFKIKSKKKEAFNTWNMLQQKRITNARKSERKAIMETAQMHLVVATLLMTITFAAGFTLPGGFESDPSSSNKGMAILISKTAFRAFVVSDAIAFACSAGAVLSYFFMAFISENPSENTVIVMRKFAAVAIQLQLLAMSTVVIAFVTGMYAALAHSIGLAVTVCAIGCISFLLNVVRAFRIL